MGICCKAAQVCRLTIMVENALRQTNLLPNLDPKETEQINAWILSKSANKLVFNQFEASMQRNSNPSLRQQRILDQNGRQRVIILPLHPTNNKGLIVYEHTFYYGEIINFAANSNQATLHCYQPEGHFVYMVNGSWENDNLKKGSVSKIAEELQTVLYRITRNGENALIEFEGHSSIQSYEGTINWSELHSTKMLTGSGTIKFLNGATYVGEVKNGLMDTSETLKNAVYKTKNEMEVYEGPFREGQRHGEGTSLVKEESNRYSYTLTWNNGVPDLETFAYNSRDPRETYLKSSKARF